MLISATPVIRGWFPLISLHGSLGVVCDRLAWVNVTRTLGEHLSFAHTGKRDRVFL